MRVIKSIILCLIISSCVTQNRCDQKFPPIITDSVMIIQSLVIDTVYKWQEPKSEYYNFSDILIDTSYTYHQEQKKGDKSAVIDIYKGVAKVTCKEGAYKDTVTFLRAEKTTTKKNTIQPETKTIIVHPWYEKPLIIYFFFSLLIIFGFILGKFYKI